METTTKTFWTDTLGKIFPENYPKPLKEWGLYFPFYQMSGRSTHWFKHNDIIVGCYTESPRLVTLFIRSLKNRKLIINLKPRYIIEDSTIVFESIVKPETIPLCLNIEWSKPLIEHLLKNQ